MSASLDVKTTHFADAVKTEAMTFPTLPELFKAIRETFKDATFAASMQKATVDAYLKAIGIAADYSKSDLKVGVSAEDAEKLKAGIPILIAAGGKFDAQADRLQELADRAKKQAVDR